MMRSMFSGVSGLRAHQTRMDVIGNNVANVNTVGFKSGRVTFQEVFNQTLKGASAPDATSGRGGANPMQVGLGIGVGAVDTIMTRGSLQRTDNPTDLSIEGDGFFIVKGGKADTFRFTRAGNFGIDKLGNLVTGSGMSVYGWQSYTRNNDGSYEFDTERQVSGINLYSDNEGNGNKRIIAAKATSQAAFAGNLASYKDVVSSPAAGNVQFSVPVTVYDSLGQDHKITVNFWKTAVASGASTTWTWQIDGGGNATPSVATGTLQFGVDGKLASTSSGPVFPITLTPVASSVGVGPFAVSFDFAKLTQFASDSSAKPINIDGYPTGNLVTFNIGGDGIITGIYSNGQQQPLGMLGLASFENPAGLQKVGDNMFIPTTNSGDFKKALKAGAEGVGTLNPGTLEMSNVDLSREFTDMIVTQRGFQANSRIITTSDEMLQELVNLKR
ncbi:MAG: flagellar hook protein FlgE [Clostridia bacterium]|nr:flagellar hook protein FlgE [Clostridia bacterium]